MAKKSRSAMRHQGFRLPKLAAVSLRIEPQIWQQAEWAAQAKGQSRSEFVRNALANATRDAKPPIPQEFGGISVPASELVRWRELAEHRNEEISMTVRAYMTAACDFELGDAPSRSGDQ